MTLQPPDSYGSIGHILPPEAILCNKCDLSTGASVRGCVDTEDFSRIKLIVVSDHTGTYEEQFSYPFWDNYEKRRPKRLKKGGFRLLQWSNAGGCLRAHLEDRINKPQLGLDSYSEVFCTNAVKCNPRAETIKDQHISICSENWLRLELKTLSSVNARLPILVLGRSAWLAMRQLDPDLAARTSGDYREYRRTNHLRFWRTHPLVISCNPARVCGTTPRCEAQEGLEFIDRVIEISPLPGSPLWQFREDLSFLTELIKNDRQTIKV